MDWNGFELRCTWIWVEVYLDLSWGVRARNFSYKVFTFCVWKRQRGERGEYLSTNLTLIFKTHFSTKILISKWWAIESVFFISTLPCRFFRFFRTPSLISAFNVLVLCLWTMMVVLQDTDVNKAAICKCSGCVVSSVAENYRSLCHSYFQCTAAAAFYTHHQSHKPRAHNKKYLVSSHGWGGRGVK